ncbi:hypothetical protein HMPREF1987_00495 [Peptostreptococcaceae bacterium oral taxon 113 str. W5053]|nr:hypothetical protein HMPREF1987_00495 [Peptostreptococcaceae bacterium oral taxon 113 str. W5053]
MKKSIEVQYIQKYWKKLGRNKQEGQLNFIYIENDFLNKIVIFYIFLTKNIS